LITPNPEGTMSISIDQIQVTSFDTMPETSIAVSPGTPLCDSPLCVPSWNPPCPETGTIIA
jgi:hypothetical protein